MKKSALLSVFLVLPLFGSSRAYAGDLQILRRHQGKAQEFSLSSDLYRNQIARLLNQSNESVLSALPEDKTSVQWKLKAIIVGLGVRFEVGLGPILKLGVKPRYRLVYTRKGSQFFPDNL